MNLKILQAMSTKEYINHRLKLELAQLITSAENRSRDVLITHPIITTLSLSCTAAASPAAALNRFTTPSFFKPQHAHPALSAPSSSTTPGIPSDPTPIVISGAVNIRISKFTNIYDTWTHIDLRSNGSTFEEVCRNLARFPNAVILNQNKSLELAIKIVKGIERDDRPENCGEVRLAQRAAWNAKKHAKQMEISRRIRENREAFIQEGKDMDPDWDDSSVPCFTVSRMDDKDEQDKLIDRQDFFNYVSQRKTALDKKIEARIKKQELEEGRKFVGEERDQREEPETAAEKAEDTEINKLMQRI
ncbi:MAG: hypothetical protein A2X78_00965 [Gammaproteobacteria bacterium GWE2_37_16]|nr:MAG: hypothetical protein A2X78_00965 [Gammaproteobacteria bacterium GWE2_37_16]